MPEQKRPASAKQKRAACALLWLEISPIIAHGKYCVCSRLDTYRNYTPFSYYPHVRVGAACSLRAKKVTPANWYESKDSASGAGGCSECAWVFHLSDPPISKSLDEMKRNFQMQLSQEFESHDCPEFQERPEVV
jgi:hypothetical protein